MKKQFCSLQGSSAFTSETEQKRRQESADISASSSPMGDFGGM